MTNESLKNLKFSIYYSKILAQLVYWLFKLCLRKEVEFPCHTGCKEHCKNPGQRQIHLPKMTSDREEKCRRSGNSKGNY